jgi:hypothetical protein
MGEGALWQNLYTIAFSHGEKVREAGMRGSELRWNSPQPENGSINKMALTENSGLGIRLRKCHICRVSSQDNRAAVRSEPPFWKGRPLQILHLIEK